VWHYLIGSDCYLLGVNCPVGDHEIYSMLSICYRRGFAATSSARIIPLRLRFLPKHRDVVDVRCGEYRLPFQAAMIRVCVKHLECRGVYQCRLSVCGKVHRLESARIHNPAHHSAHDRPERPLFPCKIEVWAGAMYAISIAPSARQ
jgi:hypothetical protein